MTNRWGKLETVTDFIFLVSGITVDSDCSNKIKSLLLGRKAMTSLESTLKKQRHHFADKDPYGQRYDFSSSHAWMWELSHKEGWALKNWCYWIVVLEKTLASPLDCKEIKPINHKENQPWIFIGRIDADGETPVLWPPDAKSRFAGKDPNAGKDWGQEKGVTEDEMVGWCHWHNGFSLSNLWETVEDRGTWHAAVHGVTKIRQKLATTHHNKSSFMRKARGFALVVGSQKNQQNLLLNEREHTWRIYVFT